MFKKLMSRFVRPRHHWRDIGFDELSELYTNMMFRSLAVSLVAIFIPIYLYQYGSPVHEILFFYMIFFASQLFAAPLVAFLIAKVGPKHTILSSYLFQSLGFIGLISLPNLDIPVAAIAFVLGIGTALFFIAFHVDFSKVKHQEHGGKEVGWMFIMQKVGAILGPIVGGVIAFVFGSQFIFAAALILLFIGAIPLFMTREPIRTNQKLDFSSLTTEEIKDDLFSFGAYTLESAVTLIIWPLFIGVVIFRDNAYIQLGGVTSISIIASLIAARAIGTMIDKRQGRSLLRAGAISNAILHLFRPFATGFSSVLAINLVNEVVTVAYTMPVNKGMYDAADEHPGFRIVYITVMEAIGSFTRMLFFGAASMYAYWYGSSKSFFFALFFIGAVASILIMTEKFKALDK